eukprot:TRINITY_DN93_c0_g1_i2.p1 TRINITY_DN93_c0_g1~~TRINITY_DN93_c0_g1_i2.p1  ORF type:complete len:457 (+),score=184.18 TRINITY_DN93_c0_g1_i2:84-1373(+)
MSEEKAQGKATRYCPAERLAGFDAPTVWHEFTPLAQKHQAVNLGQGFPDWAPPEFLKTALFDAVNENKNAYAPSAGYLPLCQNLATRYSRSIGHEVNPRTDVLITVGSTEALFVVTQGLLQDGDEVVVFEPAFDIYGAQVKMAGGKLVPVPLRVQDGVWVFDKQELAAAMTSKTRMLIVNSPQNPTGKVFTHEEYQYISELVQNYPDCVVIADEVYEHLIFGHSEFKVLASYPGMWERTISMSSAGKTFSATGWKIGWAIGPDYLIKPAALAHQWVAFCISTPHQAAIAAGLEVAERPYEGFPTYYHWINAEYNRKRQILLDALTNAGLGAVAPQGSFFIMAETSRVQIPDAFLYPNGRDQPAEHRDWAFCRWLTVEIGVTAIPPSSFMCEETKPGMYNYARFAFCKSDSVLQQAAERLQRVRDFIRQD